MKLECVKPSKQALKVLARLSFFVTAFVFADAQASGCENMQFLKEKSQGVSVQNNLCEIDDKVSVGASFILIPSGRLWLKAQAADSTDFQLICQNRAARVVDVKFSNTASPWITPKGFAQCSDWINNKLSCADDSGTKDEFICAIAVIKPPEYLKVTSLERTTSVKMRTVNSGAIKSDIGGLAEPGLIKEVADIIRLEVGLCRDLYQVKHAIKAFWTLDIIGRIDRLSFATDIHLEQQFRSCIESVINNLAYPEFTESVTFSPEL